MSHKWHAQPTAVDGIRFDSRKEARRYQELKLLERAGEITGLQLQPKFELQASFTDVSGERHRAIYYVADFEYYEDEERIIEDTKGAETAVFKLKKKLFLFQYRIPLRIT